MFLWFGRRRFILSLSLLVPGCADAAVTVGQDTITLKTWSEGLPDINPWFEVLAGNNYAVYPYTMRNNFGASTSNVAWRELTLENEYLFCRVFPDLGGHLYSCKDKINNVEMFYANPVIRKGYAGLRGAWVAVGIELNFPVGHSLVSVSPVSFGTQQNPDGSGGVWVADVDRQTGMEWRVEFVLRPGSAMLEQNVWLYNRGEVRQPYYWWSNSEETEADQNDTFVLPTNVSGTHGFTFLDTWPITQAGVDMSVIKNSVTGLGLFAYGSNEPFIAAYHPSTKTGTAHYADPGMMPGKKIWTWGTAPTYGDPWVQANLTENFPSYIETQAGVTPNQETRLWLDPQQSSHFTEYWIPARGLDGISRANSKGVLYLGRTTLNSQSALVIELNVTQSITGATIRILNGTTPAVPDTTVNLDPAVTYQQTAGGVASNVNYTLQLLDSGGNVLLAHTENQYSALKASDVTLGNQPPANFGTPGTEPYFLAYTAYEEQYRQYSLAEHFYDTGLATVTGSTALRKGSGRLAYLAARYDDAATLLAQVVAQAPNDHEAHYYLGLAYAALGRSDAAASEWSGIQSTSDFGPAATFELACLRALTGDLSTAANLFDTVNTVRAGALEIAVLRRQGNTTAATAKLTQWRAASPTDLFLRYEATLTGTPDSTLLNDLGAEPERVLNVVDDYLRLGSFNDALTLLNQIYPTNLPGNQMEPGAVPPQNNALIAYYRGYCRQQLGGSAAGDFNAASAMPLQYIFPNRASSFAVLRAAVAANANDASAHYLLGLLYMSVLQVDNAIAEWQTARSLNKTLPALHRNLGRAYLDVKDDPNTALPILTEGLNYEPSNSDLQDAYNRAKTASQNNASCPFTLTSPASVTVGPDATTVSVSFTGPSNCSWTATGYHEWITNASASLQGQGPATAVFAVRANTRLSARSQTLLVAGQPFTVTQRAATCSYSLTGSSATAPAAGGTIIVGVNSPSDACPWKASTTAPWLTIASGASGNGGVVTITAPPYSGNSRSGIVTIAGNTFTVNQGTAPTTYQISGQVTFSGAGLSGVSIALSGSQNGSAITDSSGSYSFTGLTSGAYSVTPSFSGYSFNPPSQSFNNLSANQTVTFTATATPTTSNLARGKLAAQSSTTGGYGPMTGASSAVDGNTDGNFYNGSVSHTNADANAWWQVDLGGSASVSSIVIWNRTDCCGDRLSDYWVFASNTPFGPADTPATLQGRAGTWSSHQTTFPNPSTTITVNAPGRYVRVQLSGSNYLHLAEVQVFGTTSATPTYGISGQVTLSSAGQSGVTVTLSGAQGGSTTTNGSGNYSFTGLAPGGNYTVTPSLSGYSFNPPSQTFNNLNANQIVNFTATAMPTYGISGQVTLSGAGQSGVMVTLSGSQGGSTTTNSSGNYSFTGLASGGNYTVTPSLSGYSFSPSNQTINNLGANQSVNFAATATSTTSNLALGKAATQSSTMGGYGPMTGASSAVDGNTDGNFYNGSVSHTNADANAWWQVDLGSSASVSSIVIWNRTDCCGDRLSDYWVFVSNTPFGPADTPATLQGRAGTWSSHQTTFPNPSTTITVNAAGRYVRVQLSGSNYLNLAEVQVFGTASATPTYGISGQVTVSGAGQSGVTVTLSGSQGGSTITNSSGNYSFTGLVPGGNYTVTPSLSGYSFNPPSQTFNNLNANQTVNFTATATSTSSNLALGKLATQSSTGGYGPTAVASSAVDGNTDGNFYDGSVSHTNFDANAWWQVDLGSSATVNSIVIWNRTDCCEDRLSDYWVFVSNTPFDPTDTPATLQSRTGTWSSHQTTFPNPSTAIAVNAPGRYVRVQLSGSNYLHLAEVQVLGH